jgi:hypothetical protein
MWLVYVLIQYYNSCISSLEKPTISKRQTSPVPRSESFGFGHDAMTPLN